MTREEQAQLDEALAMLPPGHAALVSRLVEPRWRRQQRRLDRRDALIRETRANHFPGDLRATAKEMGQALSRYLSSSWLRDRYYSELPAGSDALRTALHQIALENHGAALGEAQLYNVFRGVRTPDLVK